MRRILSLGLIVIVLSGILSACNFGSAPTDNAEAKLLTDLPALVLTVQAQSGTFNTVGQTIGYQYVVTNSGTTLLTGPVTVIDNKVTGIICPEVKTVGNKDDNLDPSESVTCTSIYTLTQADVNSASVVNTATANAGGANSNTLATTVQLTISKVLELVSTASPTTYNQAGQVITFTYSIKNTGATAVGPAQFVISDDHLGTVKCGAQDSTLATNQSLTCTGTYTTTENDRAANQVVFNAVVSGGGAANIQPLSVTLANTNVPGNTSSNLTRGATIQHQVSEGEWMIQIARCYGADYNALRSANPQVTNPAMIWPVNVLTVPNIGSNGKIYGPPCVVYYTAQSGDTWNTVAQKYNADLAVLLEANKGLNVANGVKLKIPLNSANGNPAQPVPTTDANSPIRINLQSGSNPVTLSGTVTASKGKERYVVTASQGQTLSVKLTAPGTDLQLAILNNTDGTLLKAQDATLIWSGQIPANGDYIIRIVNATAADKLYTLEVGLSAPTTGSGTERVADINAGAGDSNPAHLAVFNGALYFNATGSNNAGAELWKYDATTNAVTLVKDIFPGADGSNPSFLASYKGSLYFSANGNDNAGVELWRFNGTDAGRLSDINAGTGNANPSYMTVYNDRLYFSAKGGDDKGVELWQTDGTTLSLVADIYSGAGDSNPAYLAVYNNALYFSATSNDGKGTELWKYDGTTASRVTDINPEVGNSNPAFLTVFNNALYFSANANDGKGAELWKYDGTTASLAADINSGAGDSIPTYLTVFNGALYFGANGNDSAGFELWKFDGATPNRVSDINKSGDAFPSSLAAYNNQLYFQANGNDNTGKELWKLKGP